MSSNRYAKYYMVAQEFARLKKQTNPLRVTMDDNITTPGYLKMYVRQRYAGKVLDSAAIKLIKCANS